MLFVLASHNTPLRSILQITETGELILDGFNTEQSLCRCSLAGRNGLKLEHSGTIMNERRTGSGLIVVEVMSPRIL